MATPLVTPEKCSSERSGTMLSLWMSVSSARLSTSASVSLSCLHSHSARASASGSTSTLSSRSCCPGVRPRSSLSSVHPLSRSSASTNCSLSFTLSDSSASYASISVSTPSKSPRSSASFQYSVMGTSPKKCGLRSFIAPISPSPRQEKVRASSFVQTSVSQPSSAPRSLSTGHSRTPNSGRCSAESSYTTNARRGSSATVRGFASASANTISTPRPKMLA